MTGADAFVLAPIMDPEAAEREEAPREKKDKVSGSANWVARRVARRRLRAAGGNTHSRFDDQDRFGRSAPEAVEVGGLSLRRRVPWQPGPDGTTCSPALGRTDTLLVPCPRLRVFFFGLGPLPRRGQRRHGGEAREGRQDRRRRRGRGPGRRQGLGIAEWGRGRGREVPIKISRGGKRRGSDQEVSSPPPPPFRRLPF